MPVEAFDAALARDDHRDRLAVGIHERPGHGFLADLEVSRHRNKSFERNAGATDGLPDALMRHQQMRCESVGLALDPPPAILAARIKRMQIAKRAFHRLTRSLLVRFDEEVPQLMRN